MKSSEHKSAATYVYGTILRTGLVLLPSEVDGLKRQDYEFSRVSTYEPQDVGNEWNCRDYDWTTASCCLWKHHDSTIDFRCLLSEEGLVYLYGPGGKPDRTFQIPEAGVFGPGAAGFGYVERIRAIGQGLYVCGSQRQVYRYVPGARNPLSGQWVNLAGTMRQVIPKPPAQQGPEFSKWVDIDMVHFNDIAGPSEQDIYATGDETWHFDGSTWRQLTLPVTDEPMHVIKVLNAQRIVLGGRNGYLLLGNVQEGFVNISHPEDNHTITGLEWFDDKLFIASDAGLFTYNPPTKRQDPYRTNLAVDLVDAHLLEAKDGVLWSFGYKDLAYWDSNNGNTEWVRVHHPDNPRVDEVQPQKASRRPHEAPSPEAREELAQAQAAALGWLPKPQAGKLDIGGWMQRVGHRGVGAFVLEQLAPLGFKPQEVLRVHTGKRYTLALPKQGVELELQCQNKSGKDGQHPERWGLAQVRLLTQNVNPYNHWQGPWPGPIDPDAGRAAVLQRAAQLWGEPDLNNEKEQSYFVDGPHGTARVIHLTWSKVPDRLESLEVSHLGGYLPWPNGA